MSMRQLGKWIYSNELDSTIMTSLIPFHPTLLICRVWLLSSPFLSSSYYYYFYLSTTTVLSATSATMTVGATVGATSSATRAFSLDRDRRLQQMLTWPSVTTHDHYHDSHHHDSHHHTLHTLHTLPTTPPFPAPPAPAAPVVVVVLLLSSSQCCCLVVVLFLTVDDR
jgi:hypothetical protein